MGFQNCQIEVKGEYCEHCQDLLDEHENYNDLEICPYCSHIYFEECTCFTWENTKEIEKTPIDMKRTI